MATTVKYKGSTLTTATNQTKILKTAGKYMEDDVTIEDVSSGGSAVVVTEELDEGGGIIKHITAIDLSNDTVDAAHLYQGYTAHDFQGNPVVGTMSGGGTPINNQNKTVTPSTAQQSVTYDNGYTGLGTVTVQAMPSGTAGTPTAAKSAVSNHTITITPSVTNSAGYISSGTKTGTAVTVSAGEVVSGTLNITTNGTKDVTNYASVSVNVSGGGSATLQSKSVSFTPTESAQSSAVTPDTGYDGLSEVNVSVAAVSSTYVGTGVTRKAAATITPTTSAQTIATGTYLTGTQTIPGDLNLVGSNIRKNISIFGVTGTYDPGGGGGGGSSVATATTTPAAASASIAFTGLQGEPNSFVVLTNDTLATGASPWKTAAVVFDGTNVIGQTIRNTSNAQVTYDGTGFSKSYSNGTLTITGTGTNFQANEYTLVYSYGGDVDVVNQSVGSGATSITFTGLTDQPAYFSCIFKSNFSTSSGYQRVIAVVYDGTSTYGLEMDSSAKRAQHWTYSYNNGSLTITSQGTNAGGYFHQPGDYQLTYVVGGGGGGSNYQTKDITITPSTSQQTQSVTADDGYDALDLVNVTVSAIPTGTAGTPSATKGTVSNNSISITPSVTNTTGYITGGTKSGSAVTVSASELVSGTLNISTNGTHNVTNYASVSVSVGGITPTGNINITSAGTIDVTNYATATVPSASQFAGFTEEFITQNNERKWKLNSRTIVDPEEGGHAGWLDEGIYDGIPLTYNAVASGTTITPTESSQTIGGQRYMMEGAVTVAAISSSYVGSNITRRSSTDLTTSGATVTVPSGFYQSSATKTITNGSVTAPSTISGTTATVTTGTNTLTLTKTVSVTPNVTTAGYISSGTAGNASVSLTASVTTKAAATITPTTTNQTIASGTYLTGTQTISGDANLVGSNILSGKSIFGVAGTVTFQTYYTGSTTPAASLGSNGDIYLQS